MITKKISFSNIKEGMVLAEDVYSGSGTLLISANTVIDKSHILKLRLYQIGTVHILEESIPNFSIEVELPTIKTEQFIKFSEAYIQHVNEIKEIFSNITKFGIVDTLTLCNIIDDVFHSIHSTSALLSYLCRLQNMDNLLYIHSLSVAVLANILGKWLHLEGKDLINLSVAGILHDIGKTQIDKDILNKPTNLSSTEFDSVKKHTILGYKIIADSNLDYGIKQAVLMHHERMNGYGYPLGLHWDNVHKYAKIIGLVDVYDAMTSDRPYKKRQHPFEVIKMFETECYGVLDTECLLTFLSNIAHNYIGNMVRLSNGEEGKIVFINQLSPSSPMIKIAHSIIDLSEPNDITIDTFL